MRGPARLRFGRWFCPRVAAAPDMLEQAHAPADAVLDAAREIRRGRTALRSGRHQQVRKTMGHHAEKGRRPVAPLIGELDPADAGDVDRIEGAGDGVEAGGVYEDIELVIARG